MLSTDQRALLVDLLTPPEPSLLLERAVGTTFTLHLDALIRVPLGVVGAEWSDRADPLNVLEAVRHSADRIDVFCQTGMVKVPRTANALLAFLEPMVHQVSRPRPGRLFHPKIWLLAFADPDGGPRRFRLLVGSRNITNDRAWDAVISLDGTETGRVHAVNNSLSQFVATLPERTPLDMPADRAAGVGALADAVRFAEWERPPGADPGKDWLRFHFFGNVRTPRPDFEGNRRLVVSPFLNKDGIDIVWPNGTGTTVVSRPESFAALPVEVQQDLVDNWQAELRVLDNDAAIPAEDDEEAGVQWALRGLHAKTYIVERNRRAHLFLGSANATGAAFDGNDEVLVEIVGMQKQLGVNAVLADKDGSLSKLLVPYLPGELEPPAEPTLQRQLEAALVDLAAVPIRATASQTTAEVWTQSLTSTKPLGPVPEGCRLSVQLLTAGRPAEVQPDSLLDADWHDLDPADVTPFVVLELAAGPTSSPTTASCVVLARLVGGPEDRLDRLIARQVGSPEAFLRFLLLLLQLARGGSGFAEHFAAAEGSGGASTVGLSTAGVLESIVVALADQPGSLDDVDRLVARLQATEEGRQMLPDGWTELWAAVNEVRSSS